MANGNISSCSCCSAFDFVSDDVLVSVMAKLIASVDNAAQYFSVFLTCKRFSLIGRHPDVLAYASTGVLAVNASKWCNEVQRFWERCALSGSSEACYVLGMIQFYCLMERRSGLKWLSKAADDSHRLALYSIAVIHFNGSGGTKKDKNLQAGFHLCAKAASLGHIDAMREVGLCLKEGYGVKKNTKEGYHCLVTANAREAGTDPIEFCSVLKFHISSADLYTETSNTRLLLSDFGCNLPPKMHFVNAFLVEWFCLKPQAKDLGCCSFGKCGRIETRSHEFRRCSACGLVRYCSRACQALDWRANHRRTCEAMTQQIQLEEMNNDADVNEEDTSDHDGGI